MPNGAQYSTIHQLYIHQDFVEILAKMLSGTGPFVLVLLLIELFAVLSNGTQLNNKINLRDIDEPNQPGSGQLFYNEPLANQYQHQMRAQRYDGDQEGDIYNHQVKGRQDSSHKHQQLDETEYNGFSHVGVDEDEDRSFSQPPSSEGLGETMLSKASTTTTTTTTTTTNTNITGHINSMDQYEDGLADKTPLTRELIEQVCQLDRGSQRSEQLNNTFLTFCSRYKLENLFSNEILMSIMHHDSRDCEKILNEFVQLDETINQFDSLFIKLLSRYNCHNGYSVKWNCDDCKVS